MKSTFQFFAAVACALALTACGGGSSKSADTTPAVVQPAFKSTDTVLGTGTLAASSDLVVINYVAYLYDATKADLKGAKFDSSIDRNVPYTFTLGVGAVGTAWVPGWDQGILGMKVGGKRTLVLPASLGYGAYTRAALAAVGSNTYAAIPANAPLVYDIELISVTTATLPIVVAPPTTLVIQDTTVGTGTEATAGKTLTVKYTGYLYNGALSDFRGGVFDSSVVKGTTFDFVLGAGKVITGWDQGLVGMKVGGKRTLTIPASLAYGSQATTAQAAYNGYVFVGIPANSTLIFDVELTAVK
ncbi:MAG: FKBP-type peptidyl-prolyl cis-trans isomerase [Sphingomonadaceae bacterium]